jgi:hypothetical protein
MLKMLSFSPPTRIARWYKLIPKIPKREFFGGPWNVVLVYFIAIWIFKPFGILQGH